MRKFVFFFLGSIFSLVSTSQAQDLNIVIPEQGMYGSALSRNVYYYYASVPVDGGTSPLFVSSRIGLSFHGDIRTVELIVGTLSISSSSDFTLQNNYCDGVNIPGGQKCYFDVFFRPTVEGDQIAIVNIPFSNKIPDPQTGLLNVTVGEVDIVITATTAQYRIQKTIVNEANPNLITIEPSIKPCGKLKQTIKSKTIVLQCIDTSNNSPASGCFANLSLQSGLDSGGHDQSTHNSPRPLQFANKISTGVPIPIPLDGLQLTYESPEVAGDVILKIEGTDPGGNTLQVADTNVKVRIAEDTIPLNNIFGFYFDFANMSHPEGIYGTPAFNNQLNNAIGAFRTQLISLGFKDSEIPLIESEGAGLPLGGLFDFQNTWSPPHCTHRDGKTIDISFSTFNNLQTTKRNINKVKKIFLKTMADANLKRNNENINHWHFNF